MAPILLATYSVDDLETYRHWAEAIGGGLEIHTFTQPGLLSSNGDLERAKAAHHRLLEGFSGPLGFHGAFYDMVSASVDPGVVNLTLERYRQSLAIASALGGEYIVFHANYMGGLKLANYRRGWHERQVSFWRTFMAEAEEQGMVVLLENMWADDPSIVADVLREVNSPHLRACFDVSHAALFSNRPLTEWIATLAPYLHCCHVNNHDGLTDRHWPLDEGIIDYDTLMPLLLSLEPAPFLSLELPDRNAIAASLRYLGLVKQ